MMHVKLGVMSFHVGRGDGSVMLTYYNFTFLEQESCCSK